MLVTVQIRIFYHICPTEKVKVQIYKTVVFPRLETWSLALGEEHRLRVFENKVLRRTFGPKGEEVIEV
jgi:hypothetical protein